MQQITGSVKDDEDDDDTEFSKKSIIAFEDIHKIKPELFSQIFNVLDGVYDVSNCIIVMTSNVPYSKLDKTLLRCGRVNYIIQFEYLTNEMKFKMFLDMLPQFSSIANEFISKIKDINITPAILESYLLQYNFEETPAKLMENINVLIETANTENHDNQFEEAPINSNIMFI